MGHTTSITAPVATADFAAPGFGLLLRLKLALLRNRISQLVNQSPIKLLLVVVFMTTIWCSLYFVFDLVFRHLRKWEHQSSVAIPYVFHIFFVAMSFLLAFSTAVLIYGALFGRAEP
ncbi:MAG: hypothetical protein O7D94_04945, partial [Planctomycetota bacterium]|nr:hypothetical protein [Planctomycetota bacterium]